MLNKYDDDDDDDDDDDADDDDHVGLYYSFNCTLYDGINFVSS